MAFPWYIVVSVVTGVVVVTGVLLSLINRTNQSVVNMTTGATPDAINEPLAKPGASGRLQRP